MERISLGHVSVDTYKADELVDYLVERALHSDKTISVATLNAQFYVLAAYRLDFRACLERAEVLCADGFSICMAGRWLAGANLDRVAGVDLVGALCHKGASSGLRVYFLGGKPGAAADTARRFERECKGLQVVGISCPAVGFETDEIALNEVLDDIVECNPDIVFVGLGAPKQEMLIDSHLRGIGVPVAVGVGGSFEMLSGRVKRAPTWMRKTGLEWSFRLLQEPRRLWRRYCIGNAQFLWIVFGHYLRARFQPRTQMLEP